MAVLAAATIASAFCRSPDLGGLSDVIYMCVILPSDMLVAGAFCWFPGKEFPARTDAGLPRGPIVMQTSAAIRRLEANRRFRESCIPRLHRKMNLSLQRLATFAVFRDLNSSTPGFPWWHRPSGKRQLKTSADNPGQTCKNHSPSVNGARMNLPSATVSASDVQAAKGRGDVGPRLSDGASYAILLGGICTIAVAVYTIWVSYSSLPWWDTWEYMAAIAKGESPLAPGWLWRQHNEHRFVIQKLFFAVDLKMFHASQVFLLASIAVIQLLHLGLWGWSMRVLGGWRGALWRSGVGLVAFSIFCPAPWLNYTMGFQVCYVLSPLFATLSFVGLLLYWTDSQRHPGKPCSSKFLWLSILAALCATYSLANGNLLWPLLVAAALLLRLRLSAVLSYAITGTVNTFLYFYHYVRPPYHADPIASLSAPLRLMKYVAVYFGSSWVNGSIAAAGAIGVIGLAVALVVLFQTPYYIRTSRAFGLQLVLTGVFCVGTAFITAAGRLNFGVWEALQNRYQTFALLFWCSLGLLLLGYVCSLREKQYRFLAAQICLLAVLVRGAILADHPIGEARAHGFGLNLASMGLRTGVYNPELLTGIAERSDKLLLGVDYFRDHQLSLFSGWDSSWLGSPLDKVFRIASPNDCRGRLEIAPLKDAAEPGWFVSGWAWDRKHHQPPREIVATSEGIITGLAAVGYKPFKTWVSDPEIRNSYDGFAGYVRQPRPGAVVKVYAILHDSPPSACYFDATDEERRGR